MSMSVRAAVAGLLLLLLALPAHAQLSPDADWRTIRTEHFRVHFVPELERLARRAAAVAETAYVQLARELVPPRGLVDLVISDDADFSNGSATPFPTNRIVIYAHPPVEGLTLRYYHDWTTLVITHELTHIFHLDRTRGWWRLGQALFGRNPFLFPNQYQPRWVSEGLAVYYESRLTGFGRLAGTEHETLARASVLSGVTPRLDELSLATPRFPGGQAAYAYGSLLFDHLGETRGPESVARFIERGSRAVVPFTLNATARSAFGISLTDAWLEWRDSIRAEAVEAGPPLRGWRELTREGRYAQHPRWLNDSLLVYAASTGREVPGAYTVTTDGTVRRIARRNGLDPNVPLADGGLLFSQPEFVSPYVIRSDLYIQRGDDVRRLTKGARLAYPDARADGEIVAMRAGGGTVQLARVSRAGNVASLTTAHPDTQWSSPRWSPDGTRIVAIRWTRGGVSEVVVLDTLGRVQGVLARERAVLGTPEWTRDGLAVMYSSDRDGASNLYVVPGSRQVSDARTAIVEPAVAPGSDTIAASYFRADGYHIGIGAPVPRALAGSDSASAEERFPASTLAGSDTAASMPPAAVHDGPVSEYSPWGALLPRYWLPTMIGHSEQRTTFGAMTSASDLVNRHSYTASAAVSTDMREYSAELYWRYAGLGQPVVDIGLARWQDPPLLFEEGEFSEAEDRATISLGISRPRYRTFSYASIGVEVQRFTARTEPEALLAEFEIPATLYRNGVRAGAGWSNTRRPTLAISPEDGVSVGISGVRRWSPSGLEGPTTMVTVSGSAYKSLDLPGFAHHVIALRGAAAYTDQNTRNRFAVGGTSGSSALLVPGVALGDPRRNFGVRGFPVLDSIVVDGRAVAWRGIRAAGWTAEYRAPLWMPARGYRLLPLFFDRTSLAVFTEGAAVWCPAPVEGERAACPEGGIPREWLASAGAEVSLDAALLTYDFPYRFRLGVAWPYQGRRHAESPVTAYVTLGLGF